MSTATIQALYVYPVKSGHAIPRSRVRVETTGLEWDRQWMVVDDQGIFLSQRTRRRLALVTPEIRDEHLVLGFPGLPPLHVALAPGGDEVPVRVWKHAGTALDAGTEAARWVSEALGQAARLVRASPSMGRVADRQYTGELVAPLAFADGFPILVCNEASLQAIHARMPRAVPMDRFRPNVVLGGLPAFAEDHIDALHIGAVTLRLVKPCTRCVVPSIDQRTGEPSTDPTPVLRAMRFDRALRGVTFGESSVVSHGAGAPVGMRSDLCRAL